MNDADVLLTISEVSVAFAGFASLVSVLGQRHSREHFDLNIARLRGMLENSLMVLLFSPAACRLEQGAAADAQPLGPIAAWYSLALGAPASALAVSAERPFR